MGNTLTRILIAASLIAGIHLGAHLLRISLRPPVVLAPSHDIRELPLHLGRWQGRPKDIDDYQFQALHADTTVTREYTDGNGPWVWYHSAVFTKNYDDGLFHEPPNCLRTKGWRLLDSHPLELEYKGKTVVTADLSTWQHESEKTRVLFWYELGDQVFINRMGLGKARVHFSGQPQWPPLIKVLLQTQADEPAKSEARLKEVAEEAIAWSRTQDEAAEANRAADSATAEPSPGTADPKAEETGETAVPGKKAE